MRVNCRHLDVRSYFVVRKSVNTEPNFIKYITQNEQQINKNTHTHAHTDISNWRYPIYATPINKLIKMQLTPLSEQLEQSTFDP